MAAAGLSRAFWSGRRVFVTGHTGFKGGWLMGLLRGLGAHAHGYALAPPSEPNIFNAADVQT
jgi:CDP-glucose 4,6-dehydratase